MKTEEKLTLPNQREIMTDQYRLMCEQYLNEVYTKLGYHLNSWGFSTHCDLPSTNVRFRLDNCKTWDCIKFDYLSDENVWQYNYPSRGTFTSLKLAVEYSLKNRPTLPQL